MSVIKKKKHVSKKNKKAWRKFCDITDVEEFLEDQRLEERLGKFDTKPDNELFVVDIGGDFKEEKEEKPVSYKLRKRAKLNTTPKCFEILLPSSKVPDPNAKRNRVNPVGFKPSALSKVTDKRRLEKGVYKKKLELARMNRQLALEKKRKVKQTRQNFNKDLWGKDVPESKIMPATLCEEFVSPEARIHNISTENRLRPRPKSPKLLRCRAAIDLPHPGASYNPSFQEHHSLLQDVVQQETKMIKREAHLRRVTTDMFSRLTPEEQKKKWLEEMSLPQPPKQDTESDDTDSEYKAINPPVKNKKKDHKARRKQRERLAEMEKIKRQKLEKKKSADLNKLRILKQSIEKKEVKQQEAKAKHQVRIAERTMSALPILNARKLAPREQEFAMPNELPGSIRLVTASTNLLKDRYESLQHRGALPGAKLMMKKKRNVKSYFKAGHKVTEKDIERYTKPAVQLAKNTKSKDGKASTSSSKRTSVTTKREKKKNINKAKNSLGNPIFSTWP